MEPISKEPGIFYVLQVIIPKHHLHAMGQTEKNISERGAPTVKATNNISKLA